MNTPSKVGLLAGMIALAVFAISGSASAYETTETGCIANTGECAYGGSCTINFGLCTNGECTVNFGHCAKGGECTVNLYLCYDGGTCPVNDGICHN